MKKVEIISLNSKLATKQITNEEYNSVELLVNEIVIKTYDFLEIIVAKRFLPENNQYIIDLFHNFIGLFKLLPNKNNLILKSDLFELNNTLLYLIEIVTENRRMIFEMAEDGIYNTINANTLIDCKRDYLRSIVKSNMSNDVRILIKHMNVQLELLIDMDRTKQIKINQQKIIDITTIKTKQPLSFSELFISPYSENVDLLLEKLQTIGLTKTDNCWREWEIGKIEKNETSKLYFNLKRNNILSEYNTATALKCFNEKFGVEVYDDKRMHNTERFASLRTLTNAEKSATKPKLLNQFDSVFQKWNKELELK